METPDRRAHADQPKHKTPAKLRPEGVEIKELKQRIAHLEPVLGRNTGDLEIARELYSGMGVRASQARELVIEGDQPTAVTRVAGLSHWAIYRPPGGG